MPILKKKNLYVAHRWLALLLSAQLLAWSAGGLTFSLLDIDNVRGNQDRKIHPPEDWPTQPPALSPTDAIQSANLAGADTSTLTKITLRPYDGDLRYELFDHDDLPIAVVTADDGRVTLRISPTEAGRIALRDFAQHAAVKSVAFIENDPPLEFRGKPLPAYQVILDHPKQPHIYISSVTGQVVTRRNRVWRIFDFLWMLHIMDYGRREDFNHWLLTTASAGAVLTSLTGLAIWIARIPRRKPNPTPSR